MIEKVSLVVCDIDGTLVNANYLMTDKTKEVIEKLHDAGIYFGVASGRSIDQQLYKYARDKGFDFEFDVLIGMNGSELWDGINMQRYDYYKLKKEWIKEIIELLEPFDLNPFMYVDDVILCKHDDDPTARSAIKNSTSLKVANDITDFYKDDNAKIMFRIPLDKMPEVEEFVSKHPSPHYKAFKTQTTMLEFADRRVAKDVALVNFCKINNIPLNEVMTFGDLSNDIEMLQCSGWGVCLLNGTDDTKAVADDITEKTNDDDGFAHYIEKHVLNK